MKAIQFNEYGGPEVLKRIDKDIPEVKKYEVLIKVEAIGVNFADTARREGEYVVPTELPFIPGSEVAGMVEKVGSEVNHIKKGQRVLASVESGGYAEYAAVNERMLIPLPDQVSFEDAVVLPVQGQSAYHILKTMGRLEKGETVLVHSASGGVGLLAVQLAKLFGAGKVIATASTEEKRNFAKDMGADYLIDYTQNNWKNELNTITDGKGVDLAFEMVGGSVFHETRKSLAEFGRLVVFGVASGEQVKFNPTSLMGKNQAVIGFFLPQIMKRPDLYKQGMEDLLAYLNKGDLKLTIGGTYALEEAQKVHQLFRDRQTMGKIVLKP
ncbi:MAG TPA: NADPH:quinone oxidoreductase family protein [Pseudogracilibacillus sp.]|nr:NADPH:quinone oxidoreductase family protein [Pseudogracilibacillus sp.]